MPGILPFNFHVVPVRPGPIPAFGVAGPPDIRFCPGAVSGVGAVGGVPTLALGAGLGAVPGTGLGTS